MQEIKRGNTRLDQQSWDNCMINFSGSEQSMDFRNCIRREIQGKLNRQEWVMKTAMDHRDVIMTWFRYQNMYCID